MFLSHQLIDNNHFVHVEMNEFKFVVYSFYFLVLFDIRKLNIINHFKKYNLIKLLFHLSILVLITSFIF